MYWNKNNEKSKELGKCDRRSHRGFRLWRENRESDEEKTEIVFFYSSDICHI